MLRRSCRALDNYLVHTGHDGRQRRAEMKKEVGMWLYDDQRLKNWTQWCAKRNVKARGTVKITTTADHARCLRAKKELYPGQAIVTAPMDTSINFLVVAKQMFDVKNNFPLQCNWMNWNKRVQFLTGAATHEFVTAGWMAKTYSYAQSDATSDMKDDFLTGGTNGGNSSMMAMAPYVNWLFDDTTGRDGIGNGITRERGDANQELDNAIADMANDCGEEVSDFLENWYRGFASIMLRGHPVDPKVVELQLPGTNFFKTKINELFVPTLVPLIDCVPHTDAGTHNTLMQFYQSDELLSQPQLLEDMGLTPAEVDPKITGGKRGGMFILRALSMIEEGDVLLHRGWPKTEDVDNERIGNNLLEATRMVNNDRL